MPLKIKRLEPPDSVSLNQARGWLKLGNPHEALFELEDITPENQMHPEVLQLRWEIHKRLKQWDKCIEITTSLIKAAPDEPMSWCLHAQNYHAQGDYQKAFEVLDNVLERFPNSWEIHYDLACYCSLLGRFDSAKLRLLQAMAIGEADKIRELAMRDPDFKPLWNETGPLEF